MSYWALVAVLVLFGAAAGFSIGIPFLFLGVLLAVLNPFRQRRVIFWTALGAYGAFVAGFVISAPLNCSSSTMQGISSPTTCTNVIGIDYSGGLDYNPSLLPALGMGAACAALVVLAVVAVVLLRREPRAGVA